MESSSLWARMLALGDRRRLLGLTFIVAVALIWVAASFFVQGIQERGAHPAVLSFVANSLFAVYVPVYYLNLRLRRRRAAAATEARHSQERAALVPAGHPRSDDGGLGGPARLASSSPLAQAEEEGLDGSVTALQLGTPTSLPAAEDSANGKGSTHAGPPPMPLRQLFRAALVVSSRRPGEPRGYPKPLASTGGHGSLCAVRPKRSLCQCSTPAWWHSALRLQLQSIAVATAHGMPARAACAAAPHPRHPSPPPAPQVAPLWYCAQLAFNMSLQRTSVTSNTILSSTSSLFTFLFAVALLSEAFTLWKLGFILLLIAGAPPGRRRPGWLAGTRLASEAGWGFPGCPLCAGRASRIRLCPERGGGGTLCWGRVRRRASPLPACRHRHGDPGRWQVQRGRLRRQAERDRRPAVPAVSHHLRRLHRVHQASAGRFSNRPRARMQHTALLCLLFWGDPQRCLPHRRRRMPL